VTHRLLARASLPSGFCALSLLLGSIAGCAAPAPLPITTAGTWATRSLDHGEVTLSVPSGWNVGEAWTQPSSFTDLIGSFSNESLSPPCTNGPGTIGCGPPLQSLQTGTLLVEVFHDGSPDFTLDGEPGAPTTVSGLPARVTDTPGSTGPCNGLGADQTRTEVIPFPRAPDNWIEIDICSRGVDNAVGARIMASVAVSLAS
jgi:hypothetical protein